MRFIAHIVFALALASCAPASSDLEANLIAESARTVPLIPVPEGSRAPYVEMERDYLECRATAPAGPVGERKCRCVAENSNRFLTANERSEVRVWFALNKPNAAQLLGHNLKLARIVRDCNERSLSDTLMSVPLGDYLTGEKPGPIIGRDIPPTPVIQPTVTGSTSVAFDASKVPLVTDTTRKRLESYYGKSSPKALAIAPNGGWAYESGVSNDAEAIRVALERCEYSARARCSLYALNNYVVWSAPK